MDWRNAPTGTIRRDELLNALLALWKTQYSLLNNSISDNFVEAYHSGFQQGLEAVAQMAGIAEEFETGKATQQAKIRARIELIESQVNLLHNRDSYPQPQLEGSSIKGKIGNTRSSNSDPNF